MEVDENGECSSANIIIIIVQFSVVGTYLYSSRIHSAYNMLQLRNAVFSSNHFLTLLPYRFLSFISIDINNINPIRDNNHDNRYLNN